MAALMCLLHELHLCAGENGTGHEKKYQGHNFARHGRARTLAFSPLPFLSAAFSQTIDRSLLFCNRLNHKKDSNSPSAALYEFRVPESTEIGGTVGLIRAMDADIGENVEMDYRIIGSDGPGTFNIVTNRSTQEGVIVLSKVSPSLSLL